VDTYESYVEQAQRGTGEQAEAAFSLLIDRFWNSAVAWGYAALGDFDSAQDAAQDAFIIAYHHLGDLREARAFPAWLRRIVTSQCVRSLRRKPEDEQVLDEEGEVATSDDPARAHETAEREEKVRAAVRALPDHERSVTELFYLGGYSQQEIAETLDLPLTTVKKRLQYARERLKSEQLLIEQFYNQLGGYPDPFAYEDPFAPAEDDYAMALPMGILRGHYHVHS
jgi:RNA polymerase sigma factor (sigma-70 family)